MLQARQGFSPVALILFLRELTEKALMHRKVLIVATNHKYYSDSDGCGLFPPLYTGSLIKTPMS